MEIPGKAVGMYKAEPSNRGGMNWLPILSAKGSVTARKIKLSNSVVLRNRRQSRRTGKYRACVTRDSGFRDSGRRRPRIKRTISTGTSVMASKDEKPTANVFVQASGLDILPSCASSKKTGRNDTTMISSEKKIAGPTCFAESSKILRLSGSDTDRSACCSESCR